MTQSWLEQLKHGFLSKGGDRKSAVRLPTGITVEDENGTACLHLSSAAVCENMQADRGAFEGWCLALHRWCDANVKLSWDVPDEASDNVHYQRFLYRLLRFEALDVTPVSHPAITRVRG